MPARQNGRPLKPGDRRLRARRSGGRFSPKPHPLSLAVRAALRRHARLTSALTLGALLSAGISTNALAAVTVSTPLDVLDGDTSSIPALIGDPGPDNKISLREAVIAANNTAGADTIVLDAQTYRLSLAGSGEDSAATGDLDITSAITIRGAGQTQTVIDATGLGDRVLHVLTSASLTLEQTTVTGGNVSGDIFPDNSGGGISNFGTATLNRSTLSGNSTSNSGGGISNFGTAELNDSTVSDNNGYRRGGGISNHSYSTATLSNSTVSGNSAATGGGIYSYGTAELSNSTVSGNSAASLGGGIYNGEPATATLNNSTVSGSNATFGGGIYNSGTATLSNNSTVSGNSANDRGGGIFNRRTVALNNSTVSGNNADGGGGIYNFRTATATATLTNSTVSANSASSGGGINNSGTATLNQSTVGGNDAADRGGGIYNQNGGTVTLNESTVSGNSALFRGGGIYNRILGIASLTASTVSANSASNDGGGIFNTGTATLENSTVSGNSAGIRGGGIWTNYDTRLYNLTVSGNSATYGGGIFNGGTTRLGRSLIANSRGGNCGGSIILDGGSNLADDTTCGAGLLSTTVSLGPLADNGGPTETHALVPGSDGIDYVTSCLNSPPTDQRGIPRPQGTDCDVGAVEFLVPVHTVAVSTTDDVVDGFTGPLAGLLQFPGPDGRISLREAVIAANNTPGADTINLPAGNYLLTIPGSGEDSAASGDLDITDPEGATTIRGAGQQQTVIDAEGLNDRVLHVRSIASLVLEQVKVTGGLAVGIFPDDRGGGISNGGTATLTASTVSGNSASIDGGGIHNFGTATLNQSTVSGNTAGFGGGVSNPGTAELDLSTISGNSASYGGGIHNSGSATLENSTVSGNTVYLYGGTGGIGGGLMNYGNATLTHSTVSANTAGQQGGGINNFGTATLINSLVVNSVGHNCGGSAIIDGDFNLADDASCGLTQSMQIRLGPLADNGGSTNTHALLAGSTAIDAVTGCVNSPATDQRGVARPQGPHCDIGAFEAKDSDRDGVADVNDAFPNNPNETLDSDGDGMGDNFENRFGLNPNVDDASGDPDGDGKTNLEEFLKGTHPRVNEGALINIINSILLDD